MKKRASANKSVISYKIVIAYSLLIISFIFFIGVQFMKVQADKHPLSYYQVMEVRDALKLQIDAAANSGSYLSIILPTLISAEKVCVVNLNYYDKDNSLCQSKKVCDEWQNKQSNVFFIPSGDSFLLSDLIVDEPVKCFNISDGKLFMVLKQKDGQIFADTIDGTQKEE